MGAGGGLEKNFGAPLYKEGLCACGNSNLMDLGLFNLSIPKPHKSNRAYTYFFLPPNFFPAAITAPGTSP